LSGRDFHPLPPLGSSLRFLTVVADIITFSMCTMCDAPMIFKGDALRRATQKIPTVRLELFMTNVHALKLPLALLSTLSTVLVVRAYFVSQIWVGYLQW
jgi:hypothetical protein